MENKDYYKILGVQENADKEAIKRAYRKLAKEYHPDKHKGDKAAEAKFKEISEAYNVLRDEKKRRQYDHMRKYGFHTGGFSGQQQPPFTQGGVHFDLSDLFNQARSGSRRTHAETQFDLDELFGLGGFGDIFERIFERGNGQSRRPRSAKGRDIHVTLEVPFEVAAKGGKTSFKIPERNKTYTITIQPGTDDGKKIKLKGQGHPGMNGRPSGDLILTVKVKKHRFFSTKGLDVYCEVPIDKSKAKKGAKIRVKTIYGNTVELKIPPKTKENKVFRLTGLGIKADGKTGDQYVKIKLK